MYVCSSERPHNTAFAAGHKLTKCQTFKSVDEQLSKSNQGDGAQRRAVKAKVKVKVIHFTGVKNSHVRSRC